MQAQSFDLLIDVSVRCYCATVRSAIFWWFPHVAQNHQCAFSCAGKIMKENSENAMLAYKTKTTKKPTKTTTKKTPVCTWEQCTSNGWHLFWSAWLSHIHFIVKAINMTVAHAYCLQYTEIYCYLHSTETYCCLQSMETYCCSPLVTWSRSTSVF